MRLCWGFRSLDDRNVAGDKAGEHGWEFPLSYRARARGNRANLSRGQVQDSHADGYREHSRGRASHERRAQLTVAFRWYRSRPNTKIGPPPELYPCLYP